MRGAENHHAVFDTERVQVVEHHVVRRRQQGGLAGDWRILVEDDLQQVRRQRRRLGGATVVPGGGPARGRISTVAPRRRPGQLARRRRRLQVQRLARGEVGALDGDVVGLIPVLGIGGGLAGVHHPLAVDAELVLVPALGQVDDAHVFRVDVALAARHRDRFPAGEAAAELDVGAALLPLDHHGQQRRLGALGGGGGGGHLARRRVLVLQTGAGGGLTGRCCGLHAVTDTAPGEGRQRQRVLVLQRQGGPPPLLLLVETDRHRHADVHCQDTAMEGLHSDTVTHIIQTICFHCRLR